MCNLRKGKCGFCVNMFLPRCIYLYYIGVFCFVCFLAIFLLIDRKYLRSAKVEAGALIRLIRVMSTWYKLMAHQTLFKLLAASRIARAVLQSILVSRLQLLRMFLHGSDGWVVLLVTCKCQPCTGSVFWLSSMASQHLSFVR